MNTASVAIKVTSQIGGWPPGGHDAGLTEGASNFTEAPHGRGGFLFLPIESCMRSSAPSNRMAAV